MARPVEKSMEYLSRGVPRGYFHGVSQGIPNGPNDTSDLMASRMVYSMACIAWGIARRPPRDKRVHGVTSSYTPHGMPHGV